MKKEFTNRLEAINWLADHAEDEGQFEVLRETMQFNYIYTGRYFVDFEQVDCEVVWLSENQ